MTDPLSGTSRTGSEIAVIGMAGRFPGARTVDEFWHNLREGVESITFFNDQELRAEGVDEALLRDARYVKARGVLEGIELFDAAFFGLTPREAEITDPQHRVFLECAWEALESAGYDPDRSLGAIGVFGGVGMNKYYVENVHPNRGVIESVGPFQAMLGNDKDFVTTRASYKMNLRGPSVTVQTACSTSLVAVCQACQSLLCGDCDIALAGGCSIDLPQKAGYLHEQGGISSPDGHCRAFDARAQGTVFSNAVGIVVLKRLEDALADGDCIHAVIKGAALNNDGSSKVGYTAPSVEGQAKVIRMAQIMGEVEPDTITYVETHGTATALGDPIEIAGLTKAFRERTKKNGFCAVGSVKTNIGHTDAAAGIAGLIKTVLMLRNRELPPSLHFDTPNPAIDFGRSPFYVNRSLSEWKTGGVPLRAGVSSFGIGGTNAHVIVEEAPARDVSGPSRPWKLVLLSARTASALDNATANLVGHLQHHPLQDLSDVAYTLQTGRKEFEHRRMAVCRDVPDAVAVLGTLHPERVVTAVLQPEPADPVFLFTGQGSQYVDMGRDLYRSEPVFRETVDYCASVLQKHLAADIRDVLYPADADRERAAALIAQTGFTQPVLFTIEYALARLWTSWGIRPAACAGHSIGEYTAACMAGVFTLEDALSLVAARGRLMQALPGGSMLALPLSENEVLPLLNADLSLSVINGPSLCVVSGPRQAVEALKERLSADQVDCRFLQTSHAFHSQMMDAAVQPFTDEVARFTLNPPRIPFVSNVTGTWITAQDAVDPRYWARHMRQTVRFSDCLQQLLRGGRKIFLEVGPGHTFTVLLRHQPDAPKGQIVLSSMRTPRERMTDSEFLQNTLGRLWLAGIPVDWAGVYAKERRHRLVLPTYPFERRRCWIDAPLREGRQKPASARKEPEMPADAPAAASVPGRAPKNGDRAPVSSGEETRALAGMNGDCEQLILSIWRDLLGVDHVSASASFFDLGGTSLMALRMLSRVETAFGMKLPLSLFRQPTVRQLAEYLGKEQGLRQGTDRQDAASALTRQ